MAATAEHMAKMRAAKAKKHKPARPLSTAFERRNFLRKKAGWPPLREKTKENKT
jgi:hypothetical protein